MAQITRLDPQFQTRETNAAYLTSPSQPDPACISAADRANAKTTPSKRGKNAATPEPYPK